jgi:hypothetical protein
MQIFTYKNANIFTFFIKIVYSSASTIKCLTCAKNFMREKRSFCPFGTTISSTLSSERSNE